MGYRERVGGGRVRAASRGPGGGKASGDTVSPREGQRNTKSFETVFLFFMGNCFHRD
jgi:hypothetical protein